MVPRRGEEAGRRLMHSPREQKRSCRGEDQGGCTSHPAAPLQALALRNPHSGSQGKTHKESRGRLL